MLLYRELCSFPCTGLQFCSSAYSSFSFFLPFDSLHSFLPYSPPPDNLQSVPCIYECVGFFFFFRFQYKWSRMVFVFLWLTSLHLIPQRSLCSVTNGKISIFFFFFLQLGNIPFHMYHSFSLHSPINRHLGDSPIFAIINSAQWTWGCTYLFERMLSFSSDDME